MDAVAYSYDPNLVEPGQQGLDERWEDMRTKYAQRTPYFLATALPGLDPKIIRFVPYHVAHAGSTGLAAPFDGDCAVLVSDERGECGSHLAGNYRGHLLETFAAQRLPHSLGLMYVVLTEWPEFADLDWTRMAELVRHPVVVDNRALLPVEKVQAAGFRLIAIGKPSR